MAISWWWCEEGEGPVEAALRELYEETGVTAGASQLKVTDTVFKMAEDHLFLMYEMQVQLDENKPLNPLDPEVEEYKFVEPKHVTDLIPSYYASFWEGYVAAAKTTLLSSPDQKPRTPGALKGKVWMSDDFDEPIMKS